MTGRLDGALGFYEITMRLRAQRQQILASNMANADTPNYKARDMDFGKSMQLAINGGGELTQSNPAHLGATRAPQQPETKLRVATQNNLDGNTVDMDVERAAFAENGLHYEACVTLANAQIKSLMTVLQG